MQLTYCEVFEHEVPQVSLSYPNNGILLQSDALLNSLHYVDLLRQESAKSQYNPGVVL